MTPKFCSDHIITQSPESSPDLQRRSLLLGAIRLGVVASGGLLAPSAKAGELKLGQ